MTRRILLVPFVLVPLLAVALVGFAKGQGASEKEEDAAGEVAKKGVLDLQAQIVKAIYARDREALAPLFADDFTFISERLESGEVFNKAQFLDQWTSNEKVAVLIKSDHDIVNLHVYGDTVVMVGHSKSTLRYKGQLSEGPRLFFLVYAKQQGRWQAVTWLISDIPNGMGATN